MALVREVAATMTVQDESTDDGWEMRVYGVHWPRIGVLLMTTTSEKFAGFFGLPHLSLGRDYFTTSQRLLSATIGKTLEGVGKGAWTDASISWAASPGAKADATRPVPHCEYVVYVQVHPVESAFIDGQPNAQESVSEMEGKLRYLYGAPTLRTPELQMSI
jgi:transmembrane E3 ubiquitin-protein ligase